MKYPKIAITGGAGYVGSMLVPYLIDHGYDVTVVDLFMYGDHVFNGVKNTDALHCVTLDIRDEKKLSEALQDMDAVIHLACISNDPSFEMDPTLGKAINYDAFLGLTRAIRQSKAQRLIYASSSSVYGVQETPDVREDCACQPLTDYSKYKLLCEEVLHKEGLGDCEYVIVRPATVCGYAPRLRLDLAVNILTIHALHNHRIRVFGGTQLRPNLNIRDMVEVYRLMLEADGVVVHGKAFNAGYQNHSVEKIADLIKDQLNDPSLEIAHEPSDDIRSYHISSQTIKDAIGFEAKYTIQDAVESLAVQYKQGNIPNPMEDPLYYNIKRMNQLQLGKYHG